MLSGFSKNVQHEDVQCHNYFYLKIKIWFDQFTLEFIPPAPRPTKLLKTSEFQGRSDLIYLVIDVEVGTKTYLHPEETISS